ncbi:MAG: DUF58 domain-containing protein [Spirochaetales bacterium]|nr:DUF58 domain-containing protein [Spirochaetales bacterium]
MKKIIGLKINYKGLGFYVFVLFFMYLAGGYIGYSLEFLFMFFLMLFVFSIVFFVISFLGIKFSQYFSTDHPTKGQSIEYTLILANEMPFGVSRIEMSFVTSNPMMKEMVPDFELIIGAGQNREFHYTISCSYRGIYRVGVQAVYVSDMLHFFSKSLDVWDKTFYVYPRIIDLGQFHFGPESYFSSGSQIALTGLEDITLLRGVSEYRRGMELRNVYWKKTAAMGRPMIKEFDRASNPSVTIYLDLNNPQNEKSMAILEREDVSVDILTALEKYYLDHKVEVSVRSPCHPVYHFTGYSSSDFDRFYRSSINLFSGPYPSPYDLFYSDRKNGVIDSKSIIFITHHLDQGIFNHALESLGSQLKVLIIFNHTSSEQEKITEHHLFFTSLKDKGVNILEVMSPQTMARDLENHHG